MARRRAVSRGVSRGTRRKKVWARSANTIIVDAGQSNGLNLLGPFETEYGADLIGATVLRIRLRVFAESSPSTFNGLFVGGLGVRVADDKQMAQLTAGDPSLGPIGDPHADWMMYETFTISGTASQREVPLTDRYFDVRSMRKLDEVGQGLYLLADHDNPTAGVLGSMDFSASVLLALP